MLFRIALVVALVAGLASAALNFVKVREKIATLKANLQEQTDARAQAERERAAAKAAQEKAEQKLKEVETELATAKTERDSAVAEAEAQRAQAANLAEQVKKLRQDLGEAQAKLVQWEISGVQPGQIAALQAQLRALEKDKAELSNRLAHVTYQYHRALKELDRYVLGEVVPPLPADLIGRVLVVDPKWDFVVLDVGEDHGVVENGQMLVSRNGRLVGKVRIRTVEKDRSIANILPDWKFGEIMEGDIVMP
ncbi:MAG: hypothetical protein NZ739_11470 [Verrucomicrobiae bacterium]|nr:hypothetical protein [Verrucomicrobiae bacterium]MCX7721898.1 hypothetical protein [Verrucomicrobiae bacterium]MDW7979130.1 hypothetical protein [Verrucomicrobiales bacterium]